MGMKKKKLQSKLEGDWSVSLFWFRRSRFDVALVDIRGGGVLRGRSPPPFWDKRNPHSRHRGFSLTSPSALNIWQVHNRSRLIQSSKCVCYLCKDRREDDGCARV